MVLAGSSSGAESKTEPEATQAQLKQQEVKTASEKELLQRLVDLSESQAASCQQLVGQVKGWKEAYGTLLESVQHVEKATHFLELRSDASAALPSDERRHRSQERLEEAELAASRLSPAEQKAKEAALRKTMKLRQLDRAVALMSGSCWSPLLLCLR